jgi:hypothetical protein
MLSFRSKIDSGLGTIVGATLALPLLLGLFNLLTPGGNPRSGWVLIGAALVVAAGLAIMLFPVVYQVTTTDLIVRSGLRAWTIPLDSIERVTPTNNPLSSPAWSLDRLRVDYRKQGVGKMVLISPNDKAGFLRALAMRSPGLELRGDRLLRVTRRG